MLFDFGVFPALASKVDLMSAMKQGGKGAGDVKGHPRLQGGLIVAQVAVSVILLVGAGLLLMSFYRACDATMPVGGRALLALPALTSRTVETAGRNTARDLDLAFWHADSREFEGEAARLA